MTLTVERTVRDALVDASTGRERLRPATAPVRPWSRAELEDATSDAVRMLGWRGSALPAVWLADTHVIPVVSIHKTAWHTRVASGLGPIVDRTWWLAASDACYSTAPLRALDIEGFLVLGSPRRLRTALARLRTTAPVAALVPSPESLDAVELMRCDYYGYNVVAAREQSVEVLVTAAPWRPPEGHVHFQRKLREEQIFDVALRTAQLFSCS
ncbi:hypothetical protein [Cellulomonas sp. Leaf334]|uniref:hypothetical protein n=1 Tax=Cellulomonas sp. Leaf334 TaxID=1736339 RepID=UPI0006F9D308|nr:hypothetical protein [Cellulomonas sp. Leaf334]KQR17215.1 hypothetical protein ASF78_07910 [Cellulomonas sp. Leaf334]